MKTNIQGLAGGLVLGTALYGCATVAQPARPLVELYTLLTPNDYPAAARRYDEQGQTSVALTIDEAGRVASCTVRTSSGSEALDAATCRLLTSRARFTPARDARGRAAPGSFDTAIRWVLPPAPTPSS